MAETVVEEKEFFRVDLSQLNNSEFLSFRVETNEDLLMMTIAILINQKGAYKIGLERNCLSFMTDSFDHESVFQEFKNGIAKKEELPTTRMTLSGDNHRMSYVFHTMMTPTILRELVASFNNAR